jgi:hypothetical protein
MPAYRGSPDGGVSVRSSCQRAHRGGLYRPAQRGRLHRNDGETHASARQSDRGRASVASARAHVPPVLGGTARRATPPGQAGESRSPGWATAGSRGWSTYSPLDHQTAYPVCEAEPSPGPQKRALSGACRAPRMLPGAQWAFLVQRSHVGRRALRAGNILSRMGTLCG